MLDEVHDVDTAMHFYADWNMPVLRTVNAHNFTPHLSSELFAVTTCNLSFDGESETVDLDTDIRNLLLYLPTLQHFSIYYDPEGSQYDGLPDPSMKIDFPHLKSLALTGSVRMCSRFLRTLKTPKLSKLSLDVKLGGFDVPKKDWVKRAMFSSNAYECLADFHLSLKRDPRPSLKFDLFSILGELKSLRHLSFEGPDIDVLSNEKFHFLPNDVDVLRKDESLALSPLQTIQLKNCDIAYSLKRLLECAKEQGVVEKLDVYECPCLGRYLVEEFRPDVAVSYQCSKESKLRFVPFCKHAT